VQTGLAMFGSNGLRQRIDRLHIGGTRVAFGEDGRKDFGLQWRDESTKDINNALTPPI
jgi:hypothetical protein